MATVAMYARLVAEDGFEMLSLQVRELLATKPTTRPTMHASQNGV